jgi:hypothetical protein
MAYARNFYGTYPTAEQAFRRCPSCGLRTQESVKRDFDFAWLHHQKANKHHWQYWIIVYDSEPEKLECIPMPDKYRREMLADWIGAGKAILGADADTKKWYLKNRENIILHNETRRWIEGQFGV